MLPTSLSFTELHCANKVLKVNKQPAAELVCRITASKGPMLTEVTTSGWWKANGGKLLTLQSWGDPAKQVSDVQAGSSVSDTRPVSRCRRKKCVSRQLQSIQMRVLLECLRQAWRLRLQYLIVYLCLDVKRLNCCRPARTKATHTFRKGCSCSFVRNPSIAVMTSELVTFWVKCSH